MIKSTVRLIDSARSRSILLDSPLAKPRQRTRKRPAVETNSARIESDLYLKIITSPIRRCLVTAKPLPKDMLLQFQFFRSDDAKGDGPRQVYFAPSRLLNPRFAAATGGKGAYVLCWKRAVDLLLAKGSYKRLSSNAVMLPHTPIKIASQLARRVIQEVEMFVTRERSVTVFSGEMIDGVRTARACPVKQLSEAEITTVREGSIVGIEQNEGGDNLVAIVSFDETNLLNLSDRFSSLLTTSTSAVVPVYDLSTFLSTIVLPGPTIDSPALTYPTTTLINSARSELDSLIAIFARRHLRLSSEGADQIDSTTTTATLNSSPTTTPASSGSGVYAIYSPASPTRQPLDPAYIKADHTLHAVPLLLSLWRCRLWTGEGWEETSDELGAGASWYQ